MKSTSWKDIAELIGIATIVASLIFVGLQMRQDRLIAETQIYSEREDTTIELARLISDSADIWMKGCNGEELSELEQLKFNSLARAFYLDRVYRYERAKRAGTGQPEIIASFMAFYLYQYPGLRQAFDRQQSKYELINRAFGFPIQTEMTREVQRILPQLDAASPALPEKDFLTF